MFQIVSTSEATVEFSPEDLRQLLALSRANNRISALAVAAFPAAAPPNLLKS
jgi:hypothetical protein